MDNSFYDCIFMKKSHMGVLGQLDHEMNPHYVSVDMAHLLLSGHRSEHIKQQLKKSKCLRNVQSPLRGRC